jgi:hypothetical protein
VRKKIDEVGPFVILTEHDFPAGFSDEAVRNSKHEAIDKELRIVRARQERAAHAIDDIERLIDIKRQWQRDDAKYQKTLKYISNRKFVRVVEELEGLVVSRLMELEKANLAGSGTRFVYLRHSPNLYRRI